MAFLNGANDEPSRPTTAQSKGRLVLQVTDFLLANKVAVVSIHEIQHAGQGSSSPGTTARPTSVLRTESSTSDSENPAAAEVTGFYVTAMDEVENEYALYISRQKAEYLYRVECENAVAISDNGAPVAPLSLDKSSITLEDMATSILAHLDIIGNRHRDIGKLTCREPQAPVMKKARVMSPAKNASAKHKNAHFLQAKRQDQRAARSLQTAVRTMEAIASAHQRGSGGGKTTEEEELSPRTRKARKSSEYRLLSRMAAADSKTIWKSELESIHDDPSFRAIMEGICKDDFVTSRPIAMLDPIHSNGNKHVSSTAIHRRALPEKKTKHKELQERREKGRNARLHITRATSSSALHDIAASVVVAEPATTASTLEEFNSSNSSQRSLAVAPSSQRLLLATMNSIRGINALTGNMYSMKALEVEEQQQEQETFLRKRSISSSQKRVLKADSLFNEMPGMGVEITNERPVNRGSLSLLGSARGDDLMREVKLHVQENARRSSLVRDENGNLRRRSSLMCSTSRKMSLPFVDDAGGTLATSASAPELSRKEEDTELENQMEARSPRLKKIPTPRRVGSADNTPRQSACDQADDVNPSLFVTTGAVSSDSLSPRAASSTERAALGCDLADSVPLSPRYEPDGLALGTATPRSSRIGSTATASHIIEIQESESEQYNDSVGEEGHDDNTVSSELNGAQQAPTMCAIQSAMSAAVASPRQACWGDESLNEEGLLSTPLSPRILPCVEPTLTQQQTPRGLVEVPHLYRKSGALELRTRSLDQFPAKSSVTSELFQRAGEEILFDGQQDLRTKSLDRVDAISTASFHPSHTEDASNNVEDTAASATLILSQERVDWVNARPAEDESADVATHDDESECEINRGSENVSVAAMERTGLELVDETQDDLHDVHNEHYDEQEGHQSNKQQNDEYKVQADQQMDQEALTNEVVLGDDSPLSSAKNVFSLSETQISNAHIMTEPMRKKSTAAGMGARRSSTKSSSANITALQSLPRDSSKSPSKKSKYAANSSAKVSSSGNKRLSEHRKSSLVIPAAFHEVKDAGLNGFAFSASRKSIVKATTSHHISGDQPDIAENGSKGKASRSAAGHTKCASSSSSLPPSTAFLDIPSAYHKKWGKWLNGRFIVDKISCLQLEELVLRDPQNERHLVKLGL
uniref:Uncharacterized protein n=1 Tax=Globisporangium ultimum (strain ATCC 200006 / CBS 805.95 / DAOM BR144) TaxID=431595 RepID=K3X9U9_GLOUD